MLGAPAILALQLLQSLRKGAGPKIGVSLGALQAVKEGGDINEFCASIEEIQIKQLLAVHKAGEPNIAAVFLLSISIRERHSHWDFESAVCAY